MSAPATVGLFREEDIDEEAMENDWDEWSSDEPPEEFFAFDISDSIDMPFYTEEMLMQV